MLCRCGNEIENVPEHLRELAVWVCQKCTNTVPKSQPLPFDVDPLRGSSASRRRKGEDEKADAA